MPVPKLYPESVLGRFTQGTLERIGSVLDEGQTRADFIRAAVEERIARAKGPAADHAAVIPAPRPGTATVAVSACPPVEQPARPKLGPLEPVLLADLEHVTRRALESGAARNDLGAMLIRMGLELMRPLSGDPGHERLIARSLAAAQAANPGRSGMSGTGEATPADPDVAPSGIEPKGTG